MREFIEKHREFVKEYTRESPDVVRYDRQFVTNWETVVDQYEKLQRCVEYFRIEAMILVELKHMDASAFNKLTVDGVIKRIVPKLEVISERKEAAFQENLRKHIQHNKVLEREYETGTNSMCSNTSTIVNSRDVFDKTWHADISDGFAGKIRRLEVKGK